MNYEHFYQSTASLNSDYLCVMCQRSVGLPLLAVNFKVTYWEVRVCLQLSRLSHSHTYECLTLNYPRMLILHTLFNNTQHVYSHVYSQLEAPVIPVPLLPNQYKYLSWKIYLLIY